MIKLWDEVPNDWRTIKKARKAKTQSQRQARINWLLELAGCLAIGLLLGWMYGRTW